REPRVTAPRQLSGFRQPGAVLVDGVDQLLDALPLFGDGPEHGDIPRGAVAFLLLPGDAQALRCALADPFEIDAMVRGHLLADLTGTQVQRHLDLASELLRARAVGLVDDKEVGDLHETGLHRLDRVAGL